MMQEEAAASRVDVVVLRYLKDVKGIREGRRQTANSRVR
jgi:hypothetical protein